MSQQVVAVRARPDGTWEVLREDDDRERARYRFFEIMRRHIEAEDNKLSDRELVTTVVNRHLRSWGIPIIDPAE